MQENNELIGVLKQIKLLLEKINISLDSDELSENENKLIAIINQEKVRYNKLYQENVYLKSKLDALSRK